MPDKPPVDDREADELPSDPQLLSFTFRVMGRLCDRWASNAEMLTADDPESAAPDVDHKHLAAKKPAMRKLLRAGLKPGSFELVPRELVGEEYRILRPVIATVIKRIGKPRSALRIGDSLANDPIPIQVAPDFPPIKLVFYPSEACLQKLASRFKAGRTKPSELAYVLAGSRFGLKPDAGEQLARGKRGKPKQSSRFPLAVELLSSVFYDLCQNPNASQVSARARCFQTLNGAGYSAFRLIYRLFESSSKTNELPTSIDPNELDRLLQYVAESVDVH